MGGLSDTLNEMMPFSEGGRWSDPLNEVMPFSEGWIV